VTREEGGDRAGKNVDQGGVVGRDDDEVVLGALVGVLHSDLLRLQSKNSG